MSATRDPEYDLAQSELTGHFSIVRKGRQMGNGVRYSATRICDADPFVAFVAAVCGKTLAEVRETLQRATDEEKERFQRAAIEAGGRPG